MNRHNPTKAEFLAIAQGIATGRDVIEIAGRIGVDRTTLSGWLAGADFLRRVARSLSSPGDLGAALDDLRAANLLDGERQSSWQTRRKFWQIVEATFPDYFAAERAEAEREARAAKRGLWASGTAVNPYQRRKENKRR